MITAVFKATVPPDDVHGARCINFGGRERDRGSKVGTWKMVVHLGDIHRAAPTCTSGGGDERDHFKGLRSVVHESYNRHNHCTRRLNERLPAYAKITVARALCSTPCLSAIGGGAHLDLVTHAGVVELGITVPVEGAGRRIIAGGPVFVVKLTGSIDCHRVAPRQPAIGRAADEHIYHSGIPIREKAKGRDHPDFVPGVVGNRGITGTAILSSSFEDGDTR